MKSIESDEQLVERSLSGDSSAFGELYTRYIERIYAYVFYRTFERETAEDLTSQAFMQAIERLASFDPAKGTFSAWIYRIARNLLIDSVRAKRPVLDLDAFSDILRDKHDLVRTVEQKERLDQVKIALASLAPEQQEIILLRIWDERPYAEIAHILGKSEASCKMMASRALTHLRKHIPLTALLFLLSLVYTPYA